MTQSKLVLKRKVPTNAATEILENKQTNKLYHALHFLIANKQKKLNHCTL